MEKLTIFAGAIIGMLIFTGCGVKQQPQVVQEIDECPSCQLENSKIRANCILTIYNEDGSKFLSSQKHIFCGCDNSFLIKTIFADAENIFRLDKNGDFSIINSDLPAQNPLDVFDSQTAGLIFEMFGLNQENVSIAAEEAENIYGQWYNRADIHNRDYKFYKNIDTQKTDLIVSSDYFAKGYDFKKSKISGRIYPGVIEISRLGKNKSPGAKILEIEYTSVIIP